MMAKDEGGHDKAHEGERRSKMKLRRPVETQRLWQSYAHGRSRMVEVEIKRRRGFKDKGGVLGRGVRCLWM
ncbi:MAG: translation initiation factor IF-2 associated domain-containing protein [Alphaproteobacteria bacterium GM7ARS4]|nr:translation initiation factor IF-2 associated domain-containing protein [Alphaproteobacteria bacterium GM7ARS4]